jgi:hypothetical protein
MENTEYISVADAMEMLGISKSRIADMLRGGELHWERNPVDRRGKLLRRADVEALARKLPPKGQRPTAA